MTCIFPLMLVPYLFFASRLTSQATALRKGNYSRRTGVDGSRHGSTKHGHNLRSRGELEHIYVDDSCCCTKQNIGDAMCCWSCARRVKPVVEGGGKHNKRRVVALPPKREATSVSVMSPSVLHVAEHSRSCEVGLKTSLFVLRYLLLLQRS